MKKQRKLRDACEGGEGLGEGKGGENGFSWKQDVVGLL